MIHPLARFLKIKFCGFRREQDIDGAREAGATAIGFNFYEASPRYVDPESARLLSSRAASESTPMFRVGVFVNPTVAQLLAVTKACPLDAIQLHGDEVPRLVQGLERLPPIIKAISWRESNREDYDRAAVWGEESRSFPFLGFLVDAYDPVQRGGTGKTARWDLLYPRPEPLAQFPLILAGGLHSGNVAEAIRVTRADGVDTASGIESLPGEKNLAKMLSFAEQAQLGFACLSL